MITSHAPISIHALSLSAASECSSTYAREYVCVASSWPPRNRDHELHASLLKPKAKRHHLEYKLEIITHTN